MTATDTQTVDEAPEDPSPGPLPIHAALANVAAHLPAIGKDDRNEQQGFSYRGIERIMRDVKPALAGAGVIVCPRVVDRDVEQLTTGSGSKWRLVTLTIDFTFIGPAGDSIVATTVGEGYDPSDKAANKAMTSAYKYALVQVLQIGEGLDVEAHDERAAASGPPRQAPKSAKDKTPEELVEPLVGQYGFQHAAAVANVIERLRALPPAVRKAFMEEFGKPHEIAPDVMTEVGAWVGIEEEKVDEALGRSPVSDGADNDYGEGY